MRNLPLAYLMYQKNRIMRAKTTGKIVHFVRLKWLYGRGRDAMLRFGFGTIRSFPFTLS